RDIPGKRFNKSDGRINIPRQSQLSTILHTRKRSGSAQTTSTPPGLRRN
ncbi:unnamed protein product, partial [Brassica oleracea var. botrytis]